MNQNKNVAFHTLGCKVNYFESEGVWTNFQKAGYNRVEFDDIADVYVINTCSVTNGGDAKSRKYIRRAIRNNPDAVVCVMGCFSQTQPDAVIEIDGVDIVIGTSGRDQLVHLVKKHEITRQPIKLVDDIHNERNFESLEVTKFENRKRGVLKIQDGCNNFCSFCIIPWARGRVRSESRENVLALAKKLIESGHLELVLTGIHTGAYGEDLDDYSFANLLSDILQLDGIKRLRISSIEATELTDEVLSVLKKSDKVANHLHIPIQSGSNAILEKMNRKYTLHEFEQHILRIREALPNVSITTDIIVGFPGETIEHVKESLETVSRIGFSEMHVFPYSSRTGTKAASMKNQVPEITKTIRVAEMIQKNEELAKRYVANFKGSIQEIIVERIKNGIATGHSSNYLKVEFPLEQEPKNGMINVKITKPGYPISEGVVV